MASAVCSGAGVRDSLVCFRRNRRRVCDCPGHQESASVEVRGSCPIGKTRAASEVSFFALLLVPPTAPPAFSPFALASLYPRDDPIPYTDESLYIILRYPDLQAGLLLAPKVRHPNRGAPPRLHRE